MHAHRLRGAAAIFDNPEVVRAARALEEATVSASAAKTHRSDPAVLATLEALIALLAAGAKLRPSEGLTSPER